MSMIVELKCSKCGGKILVDAATYAAMGLKNLPRHCPACLDERQGRNEIVSERKTLFETVCRAELAKLPWQEFQGSPHDLPVMRATLKGQKYGAAWEGRIEIFSHIGIPEQGQIVTFVEKEVTKKAWFVRWERSTLHHGTVSGYRRCPAHTEEAEEKIVTDQYCVLLPAPDENPEKAAGSRRLVYATAYSKTTLKGFGRQFSAEITGTPLWQQRIKGEARSGRFSTTGVLAVVDDVHPLFHFHNENLHTEKKKI